MRGRQKDAQVERDCLLENKQLRSRVDHGVNEEECREEYEQVVDPGKELEPASPDVIQVGEEEKAVHPVAAPAAPIRKTTPDVRGFRPKALTGGIMLPILVNILN